MIRDCWKEPQKYQRKRAGVLIYWMRRDVFFFEQATKEKRQIVKVWLSDSLPIGIRDWC